MRKRTIRKGLRLVIAAIVLILIASFYHGGVAALLSLSPDSESRFYSLGIFWASAIGASGVILAALGLVMRGDEMDRRIRLAPSLLLIMALVSLFFYLLATSLDESPRRSPLRPGETITI